MALSSLAKALLPEHRERFAGDDPATQGGAWPRLFARIERLVKLGLLVCPPSPIHRAETTLDDRLAAPLHRLHQHLAGGGHFVHHTRVKDNQLYLAFCGWLDGSTPRRLERDDVLEGAGRWPNRIEIGLQLQIDAEEVAALRRSREARVPDLEAIVETLRQEGSRPFADRHAERLAAFGRSANPAPLSDAWVLMRHALDDREVPVDQRTTKIERFLASDELQQTPFARLGCGLFAALGWLAGRHQAPRIDRGLLSDFQAIAVYAPYCDAMLVDRTCRRLLVDTPLRDELPAGLGVFDVRHLDDLEQWLDGVEARAPDGHLDLVRRVYGETWIEPYATILE
jgi:hypothetical protein